MKGALNHLFKTGHQSTSGGAAEDSSSWAWNVQQCKELLNSSLGTASLVPPRVPAAAAGRERFDLQGEEMSLIKPDSVLPEASLSHGGTVRGDDCDSERRTMEFRPDERQDGT